MTATLTVITAMLTITLIGAIAVIINDAIERHNK
jgi:hypothetical protein